MNPNSKRHLIVWGAGLGYALIARLLFGFSSESEFMNEIWPIVGVSFIALMPLGIGAIVACAGHYLGQPSLAYALLMPALVSAIGAALSVVTKLEATICIVMASPLVLFFSIAGGVITYCVLQTRQAKNRKRLYMTAMVLLPYAAAPIEAAFDHPSVIQHITNSIVIEAPDDLVWENIASVKAIPPKNVPDKRIYLVGFPKPVSAMLSKRQVGGIRTAIFERDVSFHEVVTRWEPPHRLEFTIEADPAFIPSTAFDRHIIVGGRFFDVLDGTYRIRRVDDASVELILTSSHRLSTSFNAYAQWWSARIMEEIQDSILQAIRTHCEREAAALAATSATGAPVPSLP